MQDAQEKYQKYQDEILAPLMRQRRYHDVCDLIVEKLKIETDPEFRYELISILLIHLTQINDGAGRKHWVQILTKEFDHYPFDWTTMATMGVGAPTRQNTRDEDLEALGYYRIALDRARKCDQWVRYVLFDICRHLCRMEDYEQHEAYMREIMEDLENAREFDIPFLEDDWLKRVPEGKMDEDLRRTYQALVVADKARRRAAGIEEGPPTRAELEKFL